MEGRMFSWRSLSLSLSLCRPVQEEGDEKICLDDAQQAQPLALGLRFHANPNRRPFVWVSRRQTALPGVGFGLTLQSFFYRVLMPAGGGYNDCG